MNDHGFCLPAEQFKEIIRSLKSYDTGKNFEKRTGPRVGLRARLRVQFRGDGADASEPVLVWIRDLSAGGIGILHSREVPAGNQFTAHFPLASGQSLSVVYEIVHCRMLSPSAFALGARLCRIMSSPSGKA